ncbi:MAG: lipase family protein [Sphingorhabdus sp.]
MVVGIAFWVSAKIYVPSELPEASAPPRGDVLLSEFYAQPSSLPQTAGVMVRQETLEGEATLASAGENLRIMYSSTEGLSGKGISVISGALFLPEGNPPEGGWPLLVWSHGTVGIGDVCAPSYSGRGERDRTYLNPWLEQGYAIVASDYQGLGVSGTHPYMDARTMAFNNLDLIRAVHSGDFPLSKKVVIAGQSQGATGAIATASYADEYAPEVDLAGVIATGIPHLSYGVVLDMVRNANPDEVSASLGLSLYMLTMTEMVDPEFKMEAILSDEAKSVIGDIGQVCVFDLISKTQNAGLTSRKAFKSRSEFPLIKAFSRMRVPDLGFDTPIFAGSGTADKITPFPMQQAFLADACSAGARIAAITYPDANHNQGLLQSSKDAQEFAATVMSGGEIENTCPR